MFQAAAARTIPGSVISKPVAAFEAQLPWSCLQLPQHLLAGFRIGGSRGLAQVWDRPRVVAGGGQCHSQAKIGADRVRPQADRFAIMHGRHGGLILLQERIDQREAD